MPINVPELNKKRVVIIGAGFAGLELAQKLRKSDYQVVLVDRNNYHQFQPLFYQVAMAGLEPSSIVFPLRKTFQKYKNVFLRVTEVQEVNPVEKQVLTPFGHLSYDYLVIAIGADTNFFGNAHIAQHALPMKSVSEALYLRNKILDDYETALTVRDMDLRQSYMDIVIVGGGPTGVEVSGSLAEMKKYIFPKDYRELDTMEIDITLIQSSGELLKGMSKKASEAALKYLTDLGVNVKLNTRVTNYDGEYVYMNDNTVIRTKKVIWAAGIIGNKLKGLPESAITYGNRIKVNAYNRVEGFQDIFAIGDIAFQTEENWPEGHPQVAQVAIQQGRHLAKNLKKMSTGEPLEAFHYHDKGTMATIGRNRAVADLPTTTFKGAFAWLIWLVVHLFALIGARNKIIVFFNWVWNYFTYDQSLRLSIKPVNRVVAIKDQQPTNVEQK